MNHPERQAAAETAPGGAGSATRAANALAIHGLSKRFAGGFHALDNVDLTIAPGEIFALLGPNGAGKTTLISIVCGLVTPTSGTVSVAGFDIQRDFRAARYRVGLVPQELATDAFAKVHQTVTYSRGLFGRPPDPAAVERVLRNLSLWDKRDERLMNLSGGMKRRIMIAKALVHEPRVLFLDEPTAGVDVELRREMWDLVRQLRDMGVTIILTTHYIEEAEAIADRVGVISQGRILLVERTSTLMQRMGHKQLHLHLSEPLHEVPASLADYGLTLAASGNELVYSYHANDEHAAIQELLRRLDAAGIHFRDLDTEQSSLEEIFVRLVQEDDAS